MPDIAGSHVIQYTNDSVTFNGFVCHARRLVHIRERDVIADRAFATVAIGVDCITMEHV